MKKTLLLLLSVTFAQATFAQTPISENFSSMAAGNLGTDATGMTAGQNGWLTIASNGAAPTTTTNAGNSNFQIIDNGGENGQVLQLTGPNGDKGSRVMWQPGLPTWWSSRTIGNDIIEVEYDFYTGATTTSANNMRVLIYNADKTRILAGLSFAMNTKVLSGVAYYDASGSPGGTINNYLFYLGTPVGTNLTLPANTWVRIGMSYNYLTGQVIWKGPGFAGNVMGASPMTDPFEVDIVATSGTSATVNNTAAATAMFDDLLVKASATDSLLEVGQVTPMAEFSVYPNPVGNVMNINNNAAIRSYQITDLNGRVVKKATVDNVTEASINVSDLAAGVYILSVNAENGSITKKIVKN